MVGLYLSPFYETEIMGVIMAHTSMVKLSRTSLDVMHVLINAVQADHVVDSKEIQVIIDALDDLDIRTDDDKAVTKVELLYWLEGSYKEIAAQYSGSKRDIELVILLSRMRRRDDLPRIMKVVMDIYQADGSYHEDEESLTDIIMSHWDRPAA